MLPDETIYFQCGDFKGKSGDKTSKTIYLLCAHIRLIFIHSNYKKVRYIFKDFYDNENRYISKIFGAFWNLHNSICYPNYLVTLANLYIT